MMHKLPPLSRIGVVLVLVVGLVLSGSYSGWKLRTPFQQVDSNTPFGFEPVSCWFTPDADWPRTECFYMHVPENHARGTARRIAFPVIVFRSSAFLPTRAPVLHLGAGGPGAPMYLDSRESVRAIWTNHDDISLAQGRDLFVIDPRGTGLARPLLTCNIYVDNAVERLQKNLTMTQEWTEIDRDYHRCIDDFKSQDIELAAYNSLSIAQDIEMMRQAARIDRWVLIGVSYSTKYAQIIANEYPQAVESMVLDSAVFPNLKAHDNYLDYVMAPYRALYNYCDAVPECESPLQDIEARIAGLHGSLNDDPVQVLIRHPYRDTTLAVTFNGDRFIETLLNGIYGEQIFGDISAIVLELEKRETTAIRPYLEEYVAYLLDRSYGDVSSDSHYCFEDKPFTDFELMKSLAGRLPEGHIRNSALLWLEWPDYCDRMNIPPGHARVAMAARIDVPALFLHGELDTVTPLRDVVSQRRYFPDSRLVTYRLSHDVLSTDACAEYVAARFVDNPAIDQKDLRCEG